ncbi:Phosphoinositide polyphosphatase (Sac family) [Spraguea lophii 42_110]|uniref:Phosphoinositide polyphosphatase (Sac family) n=1 Tax=Spraguea lophii (strain 42_110) TaxID=1358809 RepID=S7W9C4_SPRLO|nr:Phosphoinositide polyphosphatase (Sac family) [Spraguea lophii 42_110]
MPMYILFLIFINPMQITIKYNIEYLQISNDIQEETILLKDNSIIKNDNSIKNDNMIPSSYSSIKAYGVYGIINLYGKYLLVVKKAKKLFEIENNPVYEIERIKIIPLKSDRRDREDLRLIVDFFYIPGTYFSEYKLYNNHYNDKEDIDFILNNKLLQNFNKIFQHANTFAVKCIQGYVNLKKIKNIEIILISRRSNRSIGTRYNRRGVNNEGYAANTVETEQIVSKGNNKLYYIQLRGSIPLKWKQSIGIEYTPRIRILDAEIFSIANTLLKEKYDNIFYIKLTNTKKIERHLSTIYEIQLKKHKIDHFWFDLAKENIKNSLKNIYKLTNKIEEINNLFYNDVNKQTGIIRSNCLDSLDRTNITQYFISESALKKQLSKLNTEYNEEIKNTLKQLWIENGNNISQQYTSTPFLASGVISGKYTLLGKITDGFHSIKRYFINRFSDGRKQTSYDLITGNYIDYKNNTTNIFSIKHLLLLFFIFVTIAYHIFYKNIKMFKIVSVTMVVVFVMIYYLCFNYLMDLPDYVEK